MKKIWGLNRIIVLFISIGYFVLSFEVYLQHYDQLQDKQIMWTPILFGLIGGLIEIFIVICFNKASYYLFFVLMSCSVCVGLLGLYLHNKWRLKIVKEYFVSNKSINFEILTTYTPLLAPSSFIAIGVLGILVACYFPWSD